MCFCQKLNVVLNFLSQVYVQTAETDNEGLINLLQVFFDSNSC